jgi:branched-chain amino acid transport system ATP-binding protein
MASIWQSRAAKSSASSARTAPARARSSISYAVCLRRPRAASSLTAPTSPFCRQNIRLFGQLAVWQNLWVAQNSAEQRKQNFLPRWLGGSRSARDEIDRTLEFFDLAHKRDELAANLAFGEQRRLEFARALAAKPALLLLDEPAAGMNAEEIGQLDSRIRKLRQDGITVLLIEHHVELVMSVADRVAVLNFGRKIAEGTPAAVQADPAVREAYLGTTAVA